MTECDAINCAAHQMNKHMKKLVDDGWKFKINRKMLNAIGSCNYAKKTISISSYWLPALSEYEFNQTILHEIAHALTPGAGHGPDWFKAAKKIGCKGDVKLPLSKSTIIKIDPFIVYPKTPRGNISIKFGKPRTNQRYMRYSEYVSLNM